MSEIRKQGTHTKQLRTLPRETAFLRLEGRVYIYDGLAGHDTFDLCNLNTPPSNPTPISPQSVGKRAHPTITLTCSSMAGRRSMELLRTMYPTVS